MPSNARVGPGASSTSLRLYDAFGARNALPKDNVSRNPKAKSKTGVAARTPAYTWVNSPVVMLFRSTPPQMK